VIDVAPPDRVQIRVNDQITVDVHGTVGPRALDSDANDGHASVDDLHVVVRIVSPVREAELQQTET
jgi:hypothetical protein